MPNLIPRTADFDFDTPTRDGDFDATLVKTFVETAETPVVIEHGLGRTPIQVSVKYSNVPMTYFQIDTLNEERAEIQFFENKATVIMRFE